MISLLLRHLCKRNKCAVNIFLHNLVYQINAISFLSSLCFIFKSAKWHYGNAFNFLRIKVNEQSHKWVDKFQFKAFMNGRRHGDRKCFKLNKLTLNLRTSRVNRYLTFRLVCSPALEGLEKYFCKHRAKLHIFQFTLFASLTLCTHNTQL